MLIKINSLVLNGIQARPIIIEADVSKSWPGFQIIGLGDTAVQEAKERIRVAWKNTWHDWPFGKGITINLAPADLHKEGTGYDLPMALAMYLAHKEITTINLQKSIVVGELALDGSVRPVPGVLPMLQYATTSGCETIFIPSACQNEASLISGLTIFPVNNLAELVDHLLGKKIITPLAPSSTSPIFTNQTITETDFSYIYGQEFAKRALEIAAAGNHTVILSGSPGSGKTLLAKSLPTILPAPEQSEIIEMTMIYSAANLLPKGTEAITRRPFRAPHHTSSAAALVGGGKIPRPGELSLAHRGVLFLDELPEFSSHALECLRQPLEERSITLARGKATTTFPAQVLLICSQNPCPCGYLGDEQQQCTCSKTQITNYRKKISGPLLDRIDLQVFVPRVDLKKIESPLKIETSAQVQQRVVQARALQKERFTHKSVYNSELLPRDIKKFCPLDSPSSQLLEQAAQKLRLSARGYFKIIKLARTIADLANSKNISVAHVAEALQYRSLS